MTWRIKKETTRNGTVYVPQYKMFFIWWNYIYDTTIGGDAYLRITFNDLESAVKWLNEPDFEDKTEIVAYLQT